jgi:transglutaminase-like putative cysteine protease
MTAREVCIRYGYTYAEPIADLEHRLVVVPPDRHGPQVVRQHSLEVRCDGGPVSVSQERDSFGNRVHRILAPRVERSIEFEARYRVEQARSIQVRKAWDAKRYLAPTALTTPDARLRAAAQAIAAAAGPGAAARGLAERAHDWAASALAWQAGVTTYRTPAAVALEFGKGVCQDYAHVLLAVLRLLGIPARYVSGHLPGSGPPHAWVEALVGPGQVLGLDPSSGRPTGPEYLTVAVGRDFADVTPTSGVFCGAAGGTLSYSKLISS